MAPLIALVLVTLLARLYGWRRGGGYFGSLSGALRAGVATMFVLTGIAHFVGCARISSRWSRPSSETRASG
jgi:hypothetical protein